jgi:hypothetical protein
MTDNAPDRKLKKTPPSRRCGYRAWKAATRSPVRDYSPGYRVFFDPDGDIKNVVMFEAKLAAGTLSVIASAWLLYRRAQLR